MADEPAARPPGPGVSDHETPGLSIDITSGAGQGESVRLVLVLGRRAG